MGSSVLIDLMGSIVIGGFLLLSIVQLFSDATTSSYLYNDDVIVEGNLVEVGQLLEHDFRKIGFCSNPDNFTNPSKAIIFADSNRIRFLSDMNRDGNMDTVKYYLGTTTELSSTPNPRDRKLYRVINGETPGGANLGVTSFSLRYYNSLGQLLTFPISTPSEIRSIEVAISVESVASMDQQYRKAYWRQIRLAARNLSNR